MRSSTPQSLENLISDDSSLKAIQQRAIALMKIEQEVKKHLPEQLRAACRVANYRNYVLIIEVSSAGWLTRLRYEQEKLLSNLRQSLLPSISSISYVINPELQTVKHIMQNTQLEKERTLSPQSAAILEEIAKNSPARLQTQLLKLAKHAKKSDNKD
ncbi:DUF721 domain-containing protein [Zophobihabitans entericus]|uniref:DUF721 domain-containing protein n=1 Tax=Zophobihabitans entericus TaxID=1635327 RepID=A0A6G9I961_9GAMM|nr:DciA family protein [Zophobihabitans entericus]QIQ20362.1 DUF721 domain-containing protein [Zophobihabitans entericus]